MESFEKMYQERRKKGLTQKDVYTVLDWPQQYYNKRELGQRSLSAYEAEQLAKFYNLPPDYFKTAGEPLAELLTGMQVPEPVVNIVVEVANFLTGLSNEVKELHQRLDEQLQPQTQPTQTLTGKGKKKRKK